MLQSDYVYKVTAIVTAYNVDSYIKKCINSIICQDYHNLEIIVVNDGSTDSTEEILDEFSTTHSNILILKTKNRGVSHARNLGITYATGDYIFFVDGDDYIEFNFTSYMIHLIRETKTKFCFSINCFQSLNEKQIKIDKISLLNKNDAINLLLSPRVVVGCWNKLYSRELIIKNNIRFKEELNYGEGLKFIIDVCRNCNVIGVGESKVYYYRNNNKLSATTSFNIQKILTGNKALEEIKRDLKKEKNQTTGMLLFHICLYRLGALIRIYNSFDPKAEFELQKEWLRFVRKNVFKILKDPKISIFYKSIILVGSLDPRILGRADNFRRSLKESRKI